MSKLTLIADIIGHEVIVYIGNENAMVKAMVIDLSKKNIVRWQVTDIEIKTKG